VKSSNAENSAITIQEQIANYNAELLRLRQALDLAFPREARISAPERAIFPLGAACRDLFEEVIFAVSGGFGQLAFRSVRTMYECVVFARYLSLHPEKTADYLANFYSEWAMVARNIPDADKGMPEVHQAISGQVPQYATGKRLDLKWSDETTPQMAEGMNIPSSFHAFAFDYASMYVHPSAEFLLRHISEVQPGGVMRIAAKSQDHEARFALRISHALILNVLGLRLEYALSSALGECLEECKRDFFKVWGYQPPI
jgi:hypothetical protein